MRLLRDIIDCMFHIDINNSWERRECEMFSKFVNICKDPENVARIQKYFGVEIRDEKVEDSESQYDQVLRKNSARKLTQSSSERKGSEMDVNQNSLIKNEDTPTPLRYTITNHFWYYFFLFGTQLADKQFCAMFFPFWSLNIDSVVGRRTMLVFAITLTISKWVKDTMCWPRPASPPAARILDKRSDEFGMPSTHATIGFSISFGIVLFTMNRYVYSITIACITAALWCTLVGMSRVYLGMHTLLDVFVGLSIAALAMIPLVPLAETVDHHLVSGDLGMAILVIISIAILVYYPRGEDCPSARNEIAATLSFTVGIFAGARFNHKADEISNLLLSPPYDVTWPSCQMLSHTVLRTILCLICVSTTRTVFKFFSNLTACAILKANGKTLREGEGKKLNVQSRNIVLAKLFYLYVAWFMIGLDVVYLLPNIFKGIGIERAMLHQEL